MKTRLLYEVNLFWTDKTPIDTFCEEDYVIEQISGFIAKKIAERNAQLAVPLQQEIKKEQM